MSDRTCIACGVSISHRHHLANSCSTACSQWALKRPGQPRPSRKCVACGKSIEHRAPQATACNRNCAWWAKKYPGVPRPDVLVRSPETIEKIAASKRGIPRSAATRAKISASVSAVLIGREVSEETRRKIAAAQSGEDAHHWAGDEVGYGGAHKRHRAELPPYCEHCGTSDGLLDAALRKDASKQNLIRCDKRRLIYSPVTADYMRLCRGCHIAYDRGSDALVRPDPRR